MADILGSEFSLAAKDNLYRCMDRLPLYWEALFAEQFEVVFYDLTRTYFESDPPFPDGDKRSYGYGRDHRSDCVQLVIALVITPEGLSLA